MAIFSRLRCVCRNDMDDVSMSGGLPESNSESPQSHQHQFSMLPNGSVDSGIALNDMDNDPLQEGRRGSSEEKDNMTPAQTRRKAQNRAAYVCWLAYSVRVRVKMLTCNTDNARSASAKSDMLGIWKPSSTCSQPQPHPYNQTMSA